MKQLAKLRTVWVFLLAAAAALVPPAGAVQAPSTAPAQPQSAAPGKTAVSSQLGVFVYPKNQQTEAQQAADENECYGWAKQQTGIDLSAPPPPAPEAKKAKGGAVKGAAGGAAGGAAIGAIAGDTGEGAAIGATAGAVKGRRQQKKANKQAEQQAQAAGTQQQQERLQTFKNAFATCMDARQYSVK
jgi:hypothetical protein